MELETEEIIALWETMGLVLKCSVGEGDDDLWNAVELVTDRGRINPYVKLTLSGDKVPGKKTGVKHINLNPEWNEEFDLVVKDPESQDLQLIAYDWEQVGKHDKIGMNVIPIKDLTPEEPKLMTLELVKSMEPNEPVSEKSRGQLVVEVEYKPFKEDDIPDNVDDPNVVEKAPEGTPSNGGLLVVIVHEAEDLEGKYHTNPSVRFLFKGEERKTKVNKTSLTT
ncbi:unnamed protein product [Thlaspi arvense]|uniref:C2 domain-containing protein n=1 Tax=Thlaspi arvense TaxID=13288 RepID=A0AAU9SG11_THLAR|nr:unnamed protein product [Thlaspi arvense]